MARFERRFRARTVATRLGIAMAALIVLHVVAVLIYYESDLKEKWGIRFWHVSVFDLDEEESFGTWFSTMILMFASGLLLMQARASKAAGDWLHPWWLVLGLGFGFLSMDEVVGMHEYVNSLVKDTLWTKYGLIVAIIVFLAYLLFLWTLRWRTSLLFMLAGAIYLGGALGVETATEVYKDNDELNTLPYNLWNAVEEGMEMAGVILFIYALISHMAGSARTALWTSTKLEA